jgi:hypothetical protein
MEIRWLGKVEITFKSLFLPFPSVYPWWREDSHHVRWLGDVHRRSYNYSQYLEATVDSDDCGHLFRLKADSDSDRSRTAFR